MSREHPNEPSRRVTSVTHAARLLGSVDAVRQALSVWGARCRQVAAAPLSGRYQAIITVVDRVVDSASGTFGARLELPNPKGDIPVGVKCRVTFLR